MLLPIHKVCDAEVFGNIVEGLPSRACIFYNLSVIVTKTYLEFEHSDFEFEIPSYIHSIQNLLLNEFKPKLLSLDEPTTLH